MTDNYFPGSIRPLGPPPGHKPLVPPAKSRLLVNGQEMEMFSIRELASALNREPVTIRKWERIKVIPKATYVKPGANGDPRGRRRYYSRAQVEALVTLADSEGILYNLKANISKTDFKRRAYEAFREIQAGIR